MNEPVISRWSKRVILALSISAISAGAVFAQPTEPGTLEKARQSTIEELDDVLGSETLDFAQRAILLNRRGRALLEQGEMDRALKDFNDAIGFAPKYAAAYTGRGEVYEKLGSDAAAIGDYSRSIFFAPKSAGTFMLRGKLLSRLGRTNQAIRDFGEAIRLSPNLLDGYMSRGNAYRKLGKDEKAVLDFDRAVRLAPRSRETFLARAETNKSLSRFSDAINDYRGALTLDPQCSICLTELTALGATDPKAKPDEITAPGDGEQ